MVALCATVYYTKLLKGKLYPKAARTSPYAHAQEVTRVNGKVVAKYIGIVRLPEKVGAESVADKADVIEKGGKEDADHPGEPEQVQP